LNQTTNCEKETSSLNIHVFGVFIDTSFKDIIFYNASSMVTKLVYKDTFQESKLFDPYLLHGMKNVRYDDKQDWVAGGVNRRFRVDQYGLPIFAVISMEPLQQSTLLELVANTKSPNSIMMVKYRIDKTLAVMLCRLSLFCSRRHRSLQVLLQITWPALVSHTSEPILAFGDMKRWNKRGLGSLLKSLRTALIRGIVNEWSLGEISAMMLLLKSMDDLKAGLGWGNVYDFLENLALKNKKIKEDMRLMIPKESQQFQLLH
jgi:hypothetical protein